MLLNINEISVFVFLLSFIWNNKDLFISTISKCGKYINKQYLLISTEFSDRGRYNMKHFLNIDVKYIHTKYVSRFIL